MKILSIRIKNLASLEGITEIDFTQEPLLSAGIFAITGPTGAGKSTILDALCLALYGKTPRYLQAKESGIEISDVHGSSISQGDVRGILRDGTGEGFAEVDFIGVDSEKYRATWRVRRARDKAEGSLQAHSISLKNISTNTDIPGKKNELQDEIERLVGLNFEQFTRSVLLAQGDFTAFLKASKDEKSALLEKLTGTGIYSEISKQIFARYSQEKREQEDLNLQRRGITTLTPEESEDLTLQKAEIEKDVTVLEKDVESFNREINWHKQLIIFQSNLSAAETVQQHAAETKQQAVERKELLNQVEQVQTARALIDNSETTNRQLREKTIFLQQLQQTLQSLQQRKQALDNQLQQGSDDVTTKSQLFDAAIPLLEEAKALDIQIIEKVKHVDSTSNDVKEAENRYLQLEQQVNNQRDKAGQLKTDIESLSQWKNQNIARSPVAENHNLISSKLDDAQKFLNTLESLLPQIENTKQAIENAKQAKADLENQTENIVQNLKEVNAKYTAAHAGLSGISIDAIEKDKIDIDTIVEDIIPAEAHWKLLYNSQTEMASIKQKLDNNKGDLNTKKSLLVKATDQLITAKTERETSLRMLNKARLAAAEKVEDLRTQLIVGEECPVCGSTEHPYTEHHPQLDHVLNQLEVAHQQHEQFYNASIAAESNLQQECRQMNESINTLEKETDLKEVLLASYIETWKNFNIHSKASVPDEQKAGWLAQQLKESKEKQKDLQQQIQLYNRVKLELDTVQQKLNELDGQLNHNSNSVKDAARNLRIAEEQLTGYIKEQGNIDVSLSSIEQSLSEYFTANNWFNHWKDAPASFTAQIKEFAEKWKTNLQKLEETTKQHEVLAATIKVQTQQLENLATELQQKKQTFSGLENQQKMLTQKRQAIFEGEAAIVIEQRLKQAVAAAQELMKKIKTDAEQLQTEITRTGTLLHQAEVDIANLQEQADLFAQKNEEWLTAFNKRNNLAIDHAKLLQLLTHNSEWIEEERTALRGLDDALTQAQSVLQERIGQVELHKQQRISDRSADVLNNLLKGDTEVLEQRRKEKNEIDFRLQQDLNNKQKIGDLLTNIEAKTLITENWAKLNEIIGSADGKKFRQVAQEYTLDVLLGYANIHLEVLSMRYLLQRVPDTLGLQVLDQDMGNEVRTVFSLSGGESFLVSLALALGLASLSGNRMLVESLFIDEGFGALDPATLNIAMDALERLHNQGRKVGVISHIQDMTERILVQIKVSKQNSGKSVVEVI